ncbi:DUF4232 domain-containing protein [Streptomyces polyrhachis]|uniref:DUF4232 domain-containing protein n=1 Tax=Streptomyces polyrhachis TaxID=1282885 RepID=A0ABW2GDL4_9ACTN
MTRSRARISLALCALCALTGLLAVGCGSPAPDPDRAAPPRPSSAPPAQESGAGQEADGAPAADPAPTTQRAAPARPAWCTADALTASLRQLNPAAGSRYTALVLTNSSASACRTRGYPGLQLADAQGAALPTSVTRDTSRPAALLTLAPGRSAWSRLRWSQVPGDGESTTGPCQEAPAKLRVIPPDQRTHTDARWSTGEVCGGGALRALPLAPGAGPAY